MALLEEDVRVGSVADEMQGRRRDAGYDACYVANMAKNDFYKRSIADEAHLAMFVKDYVDDVDAYEGMPFTRFYADCIGDGKAIIWEEML